jgi:hypothetical protein
VPQRAVDAPVGHAPARRVADAGLKHLHGLTSLRELDLTGTKVTPEGAAALHKALPKCKILTGPRRSGCAGLVASIRRR